MKKYLIADSGGTQTDWCFVNEKGDKHFFTTPSFHPINWNEKFESEYRNYFNQHTDYLSASVVFYGAGCLYEANQIRLKEMFLNWGFTDVVIQSDLHGACHASLGCQEGVVAIMGTGSVVCEYDGDQLQKVRGGFGYLIGDEGSGYAFGQMFLNKFLNNEFDSKTTDYLVSLLGDRHSVISNIYGTDGKSFVSSISLKLGELNSESFVKEIHKENIRDFITKYITKIPSNSKSFYLIGRYGGVYRDLVAEVAQEFDWTVKEYIEAPIHRIVDFVLSK